MRLLASLLTFTAFLSAASDLPKAEAILDKYVEVTGGKEAYDKIHSSISNGTMEIPAQNIKGTVTVYNAEPAMEYTVIEIGGLGKMEEGTDGNVAWALSAMQGARIKEGDERAAALKSANFKNRAHWQDFYKGAETVGTESVDGKSCYKIVLTPKEGKPETEYYDKSSGLLVKQTATLKTPMGEIPVETSVAGYRKESGLLVPHKMQQNAMGQQFEISIDSIKMNADIPKDRFDLPAEIKALQAKSK